MGMPGGVNGQALQALGMGGGVGSALRSWNHKHKPTLTQPLTSIWSTMRPIVPVRAGPHAPTVYSPEAIRVVGIVLHHSSVKNGPSGPKHSRRSSTTWTPVAGTLLRDWLVDEEGVVYEGRGGASLVALPKLEQPHRVYLLQDKDLALFLMQR